MDLVIFHPQTRTRLAVRNTGRPPRKSASRCRSFLRISDSAVRYSPMPVRFGMLQAEPTTRSVVAPQMANPVCRTATSIRSSVGGSLMWNSPVGPLRMDFAKVLTKESYDQTQFFRFGAQSKF
ncbi:BamA/TamA family outer membrane protein [Hyphomicrobium sp.]|uniref:BamA/TamA family outer membrane protein n=1 Tax=Hyphomicrobium sp. TaxID=82 RepID=UPI0039E48CA9